MAFDRAKCFLIRFQLLFEILQRKNDYAKQRHRSWFYSQCTTHRISCAHRNFAVIAVAINTKHTTRIHNKFCTRSLVFAFFVANVERSAFTRNATNGMCVCEIPISPFFLMHIVDCVAMITHTYIYVHKNLSTCSRCCVKLK